MFKKSDLLYLGKFRVSDRQGNLVVSFPSDDGTGLLMLREVLALHDAQIVAVGTGLSDQRAPVPGMTGYITDLPFTKLAKLDRSDSFPEMQSRIEAAEQKERERLEAIEIRRQAEEEVRRAKHAELEKRRQEQHARELEEIAAQRQREQEWQEQRLREHEQREKERQRELDSAIETVKARRRAATEA